MTVIYSNTALQNRMTAVLNLIDANPGSPVMRLLDATNRTVALVTMLNPCGAVSIGGVLTFFTPVSAPVTLLNSQIVSADVEDSVGNVVISGLTVGNSTAFDVVMPVTTPSTGQTIVLTFAQLTGR